MMEPERPVWNRASLISGALAGIAATVPMTLVMLALHSALPYHEKYPLPPRQIVENIAKHTGLRKHTSEEERQRLTYLAHFGFGATAGAVYAPLAGRLQLNPIVGGLAYGMLVWAASYLGWLPAAQLLPPASRHPARRNLLMVAAHLVWGMALAFLVQGQGKGQNYA